MNRRGFLRLVSGAFAALSGIGIPEALLGPARSIFGDGRDGDFTMTEGFRLDRDMYFNNLTIAGTPKMNGYRMFVKGTATLVGTSGRGPSA